MATANQWKARAQGGAVAFIGFILSPLSWWNDAFVNLPLAVAFGWVAALGHKAAFEPAVVVGYWLTNIVGLVLMQKGVGRALSSRERAEAPWRPAYTWRSFGRDVAVSLGYTALIVVLIQLKVLQPVSDYFGGASQ